jgi:hypothetical protein
MSIWVEVYCQNRLGEFRPEDLLLGIAQRLKNLTYLYCPEDEEEPEIVLKRLRFMVNVEHPDMILLYARREPEKFIRIDRYRVNVQDEDVQEKLYRLDTLPDQENPGQQFVRHYLHNVQEIISIQLMFSDPETMSWPVTIAAAAWFAELGNGVIWSDSGEWMIPANAGVTYIFDENRPDKILEQPLS